MADLVLADELERPVCVEWEIQLRELCSPVQQDVGGMVLMPSNVHVLEFDLVNQVGSGRNLVNQVGTTWFSRFDH